jgi:hypothetical protein
MVDSFKLFDEVMNRFFQICKENYEVLENWGASVQFVFTEINAGYWFKIAKDGKIEKIEKTIKDKKQADLTMIFRKPENLQAAIDKKTTGKELMASGDLKFEGSMENLLRLAPLFA